ncbi:MAG TPA: CHAT domain-containing protein [Candidatus Sulfotelmatobacter sp.]|nr:CHAT domain-containing protein [Candidatus Sulfotelmatobacter sp.]
MIASSSAPTPAARLIRRVESVRRERPERALRLLEREFARAGAAASPEERGELWRLRGHVLRGLRRAREAASAYARAERCYARAGNRRERGRCAIGWVDALLYLGRYREALRVARIGRRHLSAARDRVSLGRLLNNEANVLHRLDLPERALARYREARTALHRLGDRYEWSQMGVNEGNCLSLLGDCAAARRHYETARNAAEQNDRPLDQLRAEYNLAYLEFLEHRHEAALDSLARIGERSRSRGYPSIAALAKLDRAEILLRMGAHGEALEEARAAVLACEAIGLRYERAKAATFAALAGFRLGHRHAAAEWLDDSLRSFHDEGNAVWTGEALVGLATLWWRERQPLAASALLQAAALHFSAARDRERESCALALVVRARLAAGDRRGAGRALARLKRQRVPGVSPRRQHLALAAEAAWARSRGDLRRARRALERAAATAEQLASRILDEQWRASFWGEWGWPHRALAALELEQGRFAPALEALERGRGRAALGPAVHMRRASQLARRVRSWAASRYARDRERGARATLPPAANGRAPSEAVPLRRALSRRPSERITAASIRAGIPPRAALLDFLLADDRLGVITVSGDRVAGRSAIALESKLSQLAHRVLFALRSAAYRAPGARREDPVLDADLERLAALALWPALETLGELPEALAIVPAGPLTRVPWAALPLPDGRRLCEAARLALVPGLRLGLASRPETPQTGAPLVVAADAGELEHVARESERIRELFPGAELLEGREATIARVLERMPSAPWIHFAGHGVYRADAPHWSGIQLADGWLPAESLAHVRLAAHRVVLAACQTGRALVQPGEEWFGLARTLLLGGVRAVVAAQWDVGDQASLRLMSGLYSRLAENLPPARALAAIQAEAGREGLHPLDWAGYVCLGGPEVLGD